MARKHPTNPSENFPSQRPRGPVRPEAPRGPLGSQRINGPRGFPPLFPHPNKLERKDKLSAQKPKRKIVSLSPKANKLEDYCFSKVRKSDILISTISVMVGVYKSSSRYS